MSTALDCISYTKIDDIVNVGRQYLIGTEAPISKNKSYTRGNRLCKKNNKWKKFLDIVDCFYLPSSTQNLLMHSFIPMYSAYTFCFNKGIVS